MQAVKAVRAPRKSDSLLLISDSASKDNGQEGIAPGAEPRTTANSEQASSSHEAEPQSNDGTSSIFRAGSLHNACPIRFPIAVGQSLLWISQSALFQIWVSIVILVLTHIFYMRFVAGEVGRQFAFEFIGLWAKGTQESECLDLVLEAAPGGTLGCLLSEGGHTDTWWPGGSLWQK